MHPLWIVFFVVIVVLVLFLILIKPRNQVNNDWSIYQNHVYAHRGFHNDKLGIPENSIAAFKRALESGYGIELDIQLSKDRVPVVFHDFDLKRMCGVEGKVYDYTFEQLKGFALNNTQETIPGFEEVLSLINGKVPVIVDFKVDGMDFSICPIANGFLKKYEGAYLVQSTSSLVLSWYRSNRNDVIRGQVSEGMLLKNATTRPDFISYKEERHNNIGFKMATQFFKAKAVAWTITSQVQLDKAKENFDIFIFEGFTPNNRSTKKK